MANYQNNQQQNNQPNPFATNQTPNKATAFLNFYLPSPNGERKKLGAIALRDTNINEARLIAWLQEKPERVETVVARLEAQFNMADGSSSEGFDLSEIVPIAPVTAPVTAPETE